jgi:hypothetical protein
MDVQKLQAELTSVINGLIDAKARLDGEIPTNPAIFSERDQVAKELLRVHDKLKKTLETLDLIAEVAVSTKASEASVQLNIDPAKYLAISCRNAIKEKLDSFQTLVLDQVTTGGPLEARYYKSLNPSMPDAALANIEKKIEKVFKEIQKKSAGKEIILLIGVKDEKTDQALFDSRELIASRLNKPVSIIEVDSLQKMTEIDFKSLISQSG